MKTTLALLVLFLTGCGDQNAVQPKQLAGNRFTRTDIEGTALWLIKDNTTGREYLYHEKLVPAFGIHPAGKEMITHRVYCEYHLGDCFALLRLLYHQSKLHPDHQFEFYAHLCHLPEFVPLVQDTPNLTLWDLERGIPEGAINGWKNAESFWQDHVLKNDYAAFTRRYYRRLTRKLGFNDPIPDLLFDFECLRSEAQCHKDGVFPYFSGEPRTFDVLVVNSNPQSAQFLDYVSEDSLEPMVRALHEKGHRVVTTKPVAGLACTQHAKMSCVKIAQLANRIPIHIMVSTGPSWLTMNKWSQPKYRLIMCQHENVNLCPETVWARTISQAMDELKLENLI